MSFGFDPGPLRHSIREVGLLNPPLVYDNGNGRLEVVAGFRRLSALRALGRARVDCRVMGDRGPDRLGRLLLNLHDNLATRPLNDVEKAMALTRLSKHMSGKDVMEGYMPLLGLAPRPETLEFYLALEERLDDPIKTALVRGRVSRDSVASLLELGDPDGKALFSVLEELNLNINEQKKFIEYIIELSHIKKSDISSLLSMPDLDRILSDTGLNGPQRKKALLKQLREMRYPKLTDAETRFHRMVSRLNLPKAARIVAPPFFESPDFRLEVRFRDGRDLRAVLDDLSRIDGLDGLRVPWEMIP
jgi:hypothetical protein